MGIGILLIELAKFYPGARRVLCRVEIGQGNLQVPDSPTAWSGVPPAPEARNSLAQHGAKRGAGCG